MKNDEIIEEVINTVTGPKNIIRAIASILLSEYFIPPIIPIPAHVMEMQELY